VSEPDNRANVAETGQIFLAVGEGQLRPIKNGRNHYKNPAFGFWYWVIFCAVVITSVSVVGDFSKVIPFFIR